MRKYQISVGLSSDLIDIIEKKMEEGNHSSRSEFIEKIIREKIDDRCIQCAAIEKLHQAGFRIDYEIPKSISEAEEIIERKKRRAPELIFLRIIENMVLESNTGFANLEIVIDEAKSKFGFDEEYSLLHIHKLAKEGRLYTPSENIIGLA